MWRREGEVSIPLKYKTLLFLKEGKEMFGQTSSCKAVLKRLLLSVAAGREKGDSWAALQLSGKEVGRIKQVHEMQ